MSSSNIMTCITCRVVFHDGEIQREHYKSDWHRYNLKRKVINLPPVTAENFQEKLAAQEELEANLEKDTTTYCKLCKKSFVNDKAFENHTLSKKHVLKIKETESNMPNEEAEGQEDLAKDLDTKCDLDGKEGKKLGGVVGKKFPQPQPIVVAVKGAKASKTISKKDSDDDGDDEEEGWEEIEGEPIKPTNCLFCEHTSEDIEDNLEHMTTVHSFFIPDIEYCCNVEGLVEYLGEKVGEGMVCLWCNENGRQFYSLQSVQQHMIDKGHCKIRHDDDALFEFTEFYDYSLSYPAGSEETNPDEIYQPEVLDFNENMQLVLPSGVVLGHRSLRVYYKQYVNPNHVRTTPRKAENYRQRILTQYKAIGYQTSCNKVIAQRKHRDQVYFKQFWDKYRTKLGVKGNKILQTHFRRQVQF